MQRAVAAVDSLRKQTDVLVLRREDDAEPFNGLKMARQRQRGRPRIGRNASVIDIEIVADPNNTRVLDFETLSGIPRKKEWFVGGREVDPVAAARQGEVA